MMSVNNSTSYLQSVFASALQGTGLTSNSTSSTGNVGSISTPPDSSQLSPFAQLMSTLQQLQQSDPSKYQQVTQQIATNLQSASQTAEANGNSAAATQLSQWSTDFTNASKNGQLPNIQHLAQAVSMGGRHGHHHHVHAASADSDTSQTSSGDSSSSSSSANQVISQFLASLQSNGSSTNSLNPFDIIQSTLLQTGVTTAA